MIQINKIIYSKRRTLCLEINKNGELIIRSPKFLTKEKIYKFLDRKLKWIESKQRLKNLQISKSEKYLSTAKKISKDEAFAIINQKTKELSSVFNFQYNKIKISNATTRWASCSYKNTLCFTKKVAILPEEIINYIIIHELAHTKEKNHGKKFWEIVSDIIPDYKIKIKWLKEHQNILSRAL
jgi:predicted metal-dependent hydrolase